MKDECQIWTWYKPLGLGGVENFLLRMATQARGAGLSFHAAAVNDTSGPLADNYVTGGLSLLDWSSFEPEYMREIDAARGGTLIVEDVVRLRPTLLSINGCTDFGIGVAPLLRRIRPYCSILDVLHADEPGDRFLELRRPYVDLIDGIVSSNPNTLTRFRRYFPKQAMIPMRYIPYGVDEHEIHRQESSGILRLLYVGRLVEEQKRILELPRLLARLRDLGRVFRVTIVGEGGDRAALQNSIAQSGLADQVTFRGYLPPASVQELYEEHDLLLNVSDFEGFSISVIEALYGGCVPACTRLSGMDEQVLIDSETAILVPIDRPVELADRIALLSSDDLLRMSNAARARGRVLTSSAMFDAYSAFADELKVRRPLERWELAPSSVRAFRWDLSAHNPWLPVRPGLRGLPRRLQTLWRGSHS